MDADHGIQVVRGVMAAAARYARERGSVHIEAPDVARALQNAEGVVVMPKLLDRFRPPRADATVSAALQASLATNALSVEGLIEALSQTESGARALREVGLIPRLESGE